MTTKITMRPTPPYLDHHHQPLEKLLPQALGLPSSTSSKKITFGRADVQRRISLAM